MSGRPEITESKLATMKSAVDRSKYGNEADSHDKPRSCYTKDSLSADMHQRITKDDSGLYLLSLSLPLYVCLCLLLLLPNQRLGSVLVQHLGSHPLFGSQGKANIYNESQWLTNEQRIPFERFSLSLSLL